MLLLLSPPLSLLEPSRQTPGEVSIMVYTKKRVA